MYICAIIIKTIKKTMRFNQQERLIISEFIFSYEGDILIKSDAIKLLEVLKNHNIIGDKQYESIRKKVEKQDDNVCSDLMLILDVNTTKEEITQINSEYFNN